MEARRFFQPIPYRQTQPRIIGTLGEDLRHVRSVEGAQSVEHPLGLDQLVAYRPQGVDLLLPEQIRKLLEADDAGSGPHPPQDLLGGLLRRAGDDGDRALGA